MLLIAWQCTAWLTFGRLLQERKGGNFTALLVKVQYTATATTRRRSSSRVRGFIALLLRSENMWNRYSRERVKNCFYGSTTTVCISFSHVFFLFQASLNTFETTSPSSRSTSPTSSRLARTCPLSPDRASHSAVTSETWATDTWVKRGSGCSPLAKMQTN